ncbi:MAG: glycosyltransferase family 4 protein [Patescibacteria group bacterium]
MRKLRVHVINKYFYPVTAGIETNLMEVYGRFAKKGHKITMHTSRNTLSKKNILKKEENIRGMKVIRYDYKWFGFMPRIPFDKVDVISLHNFTIFPNFFVMFWVIMLKILGKKKFTLILSPQSGFNPDWNSIPKKKKIIKLFLHKTIGKLLINYSADGIRVISKWEKEEMIKLGIRKNLIELIGHGTQEQALVDNNRVDMQFEKKIKESMPFIIQIGRIHPIKNYETSIKSFEKIPKNFKLIIIGQVEEELYFKKLQELINDLDLQERVIFLNSISDEEKYYVLKNAEAMVHMSRHEGYCIAVHEAMSKGLVCVVSNTTALPELVADGVNGYCVAPDDENGVYKKLDFIVRNKNSSIIKKMKENNLLFAKENTWSKVADKIEDFYLETLRNIFK